MTEQSASAAVEVTVDPLTAFTVFTDEIDLWWVRGPINFYDASRLTELRIEPGVGGRILEVYDEAASDVLETACITVWEPGQRLVFRGTLQDTETDVRFEPIDGGTRVHVRQYLLPGADPSRGGFGWVNLTPAFVAWCRRRDTAPRAPREIARLSLALHYEDPPAAARWLRRVFQLGSWDVDRVPEEGENPLWIEFHVGDCLVVLRRLEGERPARAAVTHLPWVYVDDLDTHLAHARAGGATVVSEIGRHGVRSYVAEDLEGLRWTFAQARPTMP
ncbi:VOC family protein [Actinopolymorpha alba]|uniref:VOC family protein n=1 Tax=Actinopolymorpha alba TaxID=533267 RepID=UPI000375D9B1|nr:VOC family protein [Actinopolymorpha alba]